MTDATGLALHIHAEAKTGKTWLLATAPKPLLVIDTDSPASTRFLPLKKVVWHAERGDPPPDPKQGWEIAVVMMRDYAVLGRVYDWLKRGKHDFRSAGIDTLTNGQKRLLDQLAGSDPNLDIEQVVWGKAFRHMEDIIRKFHDLLDHPTKPLTAVVTTAHTHMKDGKFRPLVKGQLALTLPGFPDVTGYLHTANLDDGKLVRRLAIQPVWPHILAGDRTHVLTRKLGPVITAPHIGKMVEVLQGTAEEGDTEE